MKYITKSSPFQFSYFRFPYFILQTFEFEQNYEILNLILIKGSVQSMKQQLNTLKFKKKYLKSNMQSLTTEF